MPETALWSCTRQRAGPLIKECRGQWPTLSRHDDPIARESKRSIKRVRTMFSRGPVRSLELYLALFGYRGTHYLLSYDDDHLPPNFKGVRKDLTALFKRMKRWRGGVAFDYVYAIEALTDKCRYHVHLVLNDDEFQPAVVQYLWHGGFVDDVPLLKWRYNYRGKEYKGYYGMARYFNKERPDGFFIPLGRHPWSASKALRAKLPPPDLWEDPSGVIDIPKEATILQYEPMAGNSFGSYSLASYMMPENSSFFRI